MTNTKRNYIYNLISNISNVLFSFILLPYLSRKLGTEQIGIYSYTNSIVTYFMLFSLLGIKNYGNRLIASSKDDKKEKSKQFLSLYCLQIITSFLVVLFYLIYIFFFCKENQTVAFIQTIYLLSAMFDINWFFYGNEKFKPALVIGIIMKVIYFLCIILFVKAPQDIFKYVFIVSVYTLLKNLFLFLLLKKQIEWVKITKKDISYHIKPCLVLFLPVLSVSIYKIMDKIMLGNISGTLEVGFYEQAEKIINIPLQLIEALGSVMLPKMAHLVANQKETNVNKYIHHSLTFIMFLIIPIVCGLICIADSFVPFFLGSSFAKSATLLKGLAISVIFIAYGNVIRTHYIIPKEKDNILVKSVALGALINVILNILLIPRYDSLGAVIATIIAEFVVVLYQTVKIKKEAPIFTYLKDIWIILFKSIVMCIPVICVGFLPITSVFFMIFLQMITGILCYALLNRNYINNLLGKNFPIYKLEEKITNLYDKRRKCDKIKWEEKR